MKRSLFIILFAVLFSFAWGLWYGLYSKEKVRPQYLRGPGVRVLAKKGFFPPEFVTRFSKANKINFQVVETEDDLGLLRELVSPQMNYDIAQVPSYLTKSFLVDNVLSVLGEDLNDEMAAVSVDFKNLDFDPAGKHLLPITWGVNGFLVKADAKSSPAPDALDLLLPLTPKKGSVLSLPNPVDLFFLATKLQPAIRAWAEAGNETELMKEVKAIRSRLGEPKTFAANAILSDETNVRQLPNGQAAYLLQNRMKIKPEEKWQFILPRDRARLWINCLAIPSSRNDRRYSEKVMRLLMEPQWAKELTTMNLEATTLAVLDQSELPEMQKAKYIRQLPISRVELFMDIESLEPAWIQAYRWIMAQE